MWLHLGLATSGRGITLGGCTSYDATRVFPSSVKILEKLHEFERNVLSRVSSKMRKTKRAKERVELVNSRLPGGFMSFPSHFRDYLRKWNPL
uniref:Uncharacterized protein n=1 Tax=Vespula pensylvanica TaxID=30213 RepID=A0A834NZF0_VESPE|nr:hypothetical protein H0235_009761 [Vespula pensylvanica]